MNPTDTETTTGLKTRVLDYIQSQLDRNKQRLEQSKVEAKRKSRTSKHLSRRIKMLEAINYELTVYISLWRVRDCTDEVFRTSITQLHASFRKAEEFYENPKIRLMSNNIFEYAHRVDASELTGKLCPVCSRRTCS